MLRIAKVLKSNGTDGAILLGIGEAELKRNNLKEPVFIFFDGLPVPFFIMDITSKGSGKVIVHLNDVTSLEDAEELTGRDIYVEGECDGGEEDEDFNGWTVYDRDFLLGTVTGMEPIPGNLCLYVRLSGTGGEILVPLHPDFILEADPSCLKLVLDLPEGLY